MDFKEFWDKQDKLNLYIGVTPNTKWMAPIIKKGLPEYKIQGIMEDRKISKQELRLGNRFAQGVVCKINGRTGAKVHVYGRARWDDKGRRIKVIDSVSPANLIPIRLTPEVLVGWCGFKAVNDKHYSNYVFDNDNSIKFDTDDGCWWYSINESDASCYRAAKLDYLHELQNLYYVLNKKELEVKD